MLGMHRSIANMGVADRSFLRRIGDSSSAIDDDME
jgi:hypothetical protein